MNVEPDKTSAQREPLVIGGDVFCFLSEYTNWESRCVVCRNETTGEILEIVAIPECKYAYRFWDVLGNEKIGAWQNDSVVKFLGKRFVEGRFSKVLYVLRESLGGGPNATLRSVINGQSAVNRKDLFKAFARYAKGVAHACANGIPLELHPDALYYAEGEPEKAKVIWPVDILDPSPMCMGGAEEKRRCRQCDYAPPEAFGSAECNTDFRSYVYGLGILLYEAISGRQLYPDAGVGRDRILFRLKMVQRKQRPQFHSLSRDADGSLIALLTWMTELDPRKRLSDPVLLEKILLALAAGDSIHIRDAGCLHRVLKLLKVCTCVFVLILGLIMASFVLEASGCKTAGKFVDVMFAPKVVLSFPIRSYYSLKYWIMFRRKPTILSFANAILENGKVVCDVPQGDRDLLIFLKDGNRLPYTACSSVEDFAKFLEGELSSSEMKVLLDEIKTSKLCPSYLLCNAYEKIVRRTHTNYECPYSHSGGYLLRKRDCRIEVTGSMDGEVAGSMEN